MTCALYSKMYKAILLLCVKNGLKKVVLTALATIHFHCREKRGLDILLKKYFYVLLKEVSKCMKVST